MEAIGSGELTHRGSLIERVRFLMVFFEFVSLES